MIRLRSAGLVGALTLFAVGCAGGDDAPSAVEKPRRTFEPHRILVHGERVLVLGVSVGAGSDDPCSRARDLAVLDVDRRGVVDSATAFPREQFGDGDCVETIETAFLDRNAVLVSGWATIADPQYDGADRYPYAARFGPGDGPDEEFGDKGFLGLPHPTAGVAPFGKHILYVGGVRFDRRGKPLDETAFSYSGANGRIAPLPRGRAAVVLYDEAQPNYHVRIVGPDRVGPTTSVVVARSTNYAEVTQVEPAGGSFFVLLESDTEIEVVHRHRPDGRRDRSFGREGRVDAQAKRGRYGVVTGIAATPEGGLVTVGDLAEAGRRKTFVVRFDRQGRRLGTTLIDLAPAAGNMDTNGFGAVAVQRDGRIMVAAGLQGREARLLRLRPDGRRDREFGGSGSVALTLP